MKRKFVSKAAALLLCAALLTGCGSKGGETELSENPPGDAVQESGAVLPEDLPDELVFASGAGAWATVMTPERDGTFSGEYHDSDMGDSGGEYPNGTVYVCDFSGRFSDIEKADENSYSMTLAEIGSDYEAEKEWIEDGVRYVSSEPYGIEDGDEFILYLPDTPTDGLDEEFLSWWPGRYMTEEQTGTLGMYGLYNVKMGYGFFG